MEVKEARKLKAKMEEDIASILETFEIKTGLRPGIVFHERIQITGTPRYMFKCKVNVPVNL